MKQQLHVAKMGKKALPGILIPNHAIQVTIGNNCQSLFCNILIYSQQTDIRIGKKLFPTFKNIKEIASSLIFTIDYPQHKHRANISTERKQLSEVILNHDSHNVIACLFHCLQN